MKKQIEIVIYRDQLTAYHSHQKEIFRFPLGFTATERTKSKVYRDNKTLIDDLLTKFNGLIDEATLKGCNRVVYIKQSLENELKNNTSNIVTTGTIGITSSNVNSNVIIKDKFIFKPHEEINFLNPEPIEDDTQTLKYWYYKFYCAVILEGVRTDNIVEGSAKHYYTILKNFIKDDTLSKLTLNDLNQNLIDYWFFDFDAKHSRVYKAKRLTFLAKFADWLNEHGIIKDNSFVIAVKRFRINNRKITKIINPIPIAYSKSDLTTLNNYKDKIEKDLKIVNSYINRYKQIKKSERKELITQFIADFKYSDVYDERHQERIFKYVADDLQLKIKVIDITLLSCATGVSWCDMVKLNRASVNTATNTLTDERQKTHVEFTVVLTQLTEHILNKYDYKMELMSYQHYNRNLKKLIIELGLDRECQTKNTANNKFETKLLSTLSCHRLCRKTFITLGIEGKLALNQLIAQSGHSNLAMLKHYLQRSVTLDTNQAMSNIFTL